MISAMHIVEIESPIMGPSNDQKRLMSVDSLNEIYSDGTDATDDYIINLY